MKLIRSWALIFIFVFSSQLWSQSSLLAGKPDSSLNKESPTADPLGRQTPRGTVLGFIKAAQDGDYRLAGEYLQLSGVKGKIEGEELASQLLVLIDRIFQGHISQISDRPEGSINDIEAADHEVAGIFRINNTEANFDLVRVRDEKYGSIWLVSRTTLQQVPGLYEQVGLPGIERVLPKILVQKQLLAMSLWQWIAWLLSIPLAFALAWILLQMVRFAARLRRRQPPDQAVRTTQKPFSIPILVILALLIQGALVRLIGPPLLYRYYYFQFVQILLILALGRLAWVIIDRVFEQVIPRVGTRMGEGAAAESLMVLGRITMRALLVIVLLLVILPHLGVNPITAVAGLGIGGLVVALAAQKTLENLFGGVSLLMDRVIRVGDVCKIGDRVGRVEDIGLRSIRIRTVEQTELSVPNGALAQVQFENLTSRRKINLTANLGLRYQTSPDQLRSILADVRQLLEEHSRLEAGTARIRFTGFGPSALELEIFAYVLTRDVPEFMAIREDLLLRVMDIVLAAGTDFAFSSQTVSLTPDKTLATEKVEAALRRVEEWRKKRADVAKSGPDAATGLKR